LIVPFLPDACRGRGAVCGRVSVCLFDVGVNIKRRPHGGLKLASTNPGSSFFDIDVSFYDAKKRGKAFRGVVKNRG
jgi:hypothetical protein